MRDEDRETFRKAFENIAPEKIEAGLRAVAEREARSAVEECSWREDERERLARQQAAQPPKPARPRLDTMPTSWRVEIDRKISIAIREAFDSERPLLKHVVSEIREAMEDMAAANAADLQHEVRTLSVELAELKATLAELRTV